LTPFDGTTERPTSARLSQNNRVKPVRGEESGLEACYGKTLHLQGFPIERLSRRASPVHYAVPCEGRDSVVA